MMSFSLSGGVEVFGFISPSDPIDTYPVIDPLYGIDGFRNVDTLIDLNNIPTPRRRAGMVVGVSGGTQYYKLNVGPWNGTITDWTIFNSGGGIFTGGTVSGSTVFTNGLSATTFSATTYLGLPLDVYVTGGTYDNNTGVATFTNNTGGTFNVNGFITGFTDIQVTGYTYQDNIFTIFDSSGNTFSATIDTVTGLTINGDLTVTGNTSLQVLSATTINANTYYGDGSNLTGISRGGGSGQLYYFNISNTQTPYYEFSTTATTSTEQTISATTGANSTVYIGGFMTPLNVPNITNIPPGIISFYLHTYDDGTNYSFNIYCELYTRTTGGTETLLFTSDPVIVVGNTPTMVISDGFFSGVTLNVSDRLVVKLYGTNITNQTRTIYFVSEGSNHYSFSLTTIPSFIDTYVTGFTYNNNNFTISQTVGSPLTTTINTVTGLTVNGDLIITGNTTLNTLSATTISGSSISAPGISTQVVYNNGGILSANTGFTYNNINKISLGQSGTTITGNGEVALIRYTTGTEVGGIRVEASTAGVELGGAGYYDKVFTTNGAGIRFWTYVSGTTNAERMRITSGTGTNWGVGIGTTSPTATLQVSGTTLLQTVTGTTALFSGSGQNILTVVGSGNTTSSPLFTVQGSSGELFSVTDSLVGSLYSVNDISGLPILEVFSDNTILMGSYLAPSLNTTTKVTATTGTTNVYSIPTSAYTGAFFDYTVSDGTNLRAGNIMSIWSGSSVNYTETQTTDFGNTSGLTFNMVVSSGNAILRTSGVTGNWTVKTIVRSI